MALYKQAADVLMKVEVGKGSIKGVIFAMKSEPKQKKRLFALVCEALKYRDIIECMIDNSDMMKGTKKINRSIGIFLVYDLFFGKGMGEAGSFKPWILQHKTRLNAELVKIKIKRKVKDNVDLIPDHIRNAVVLPRYARVNTLVTTVSNVLDALKKEGYTVLDVSDRSYELKPKTVRVDHHIPEILLLPSNSDFHDHNLLLKGHVILQDKASCFPAFILNPPRNAVVIDACAAPGNKTSHLSAIMQNTGRIHAFDLDANRLKTLVKLTDRAHCKNITPRNVSFLEVKPGSEEYREVEYILLDPSCSGSGIVRRLDHLLTVVICKGAEDNEEHGETPQTEKSRVDALADFQVSVLMHAFKFPNVKKVVYSTCSKHAEENENVVKRVLAAQKRFRLARKVFPGWERRGLDIVEGHESLVRSVPEEDHVIGFFVALFERVATEGEDEGEDADAMAEVETRSSQEERGERGDKKKKKKKKKKQQQQQQ
ncbi:putative 28S rRNA (cytosine-C(5))-methyltransferase [Dinochytrium kinnereticum]|nr:putative 28S rRNA (cytosine-C(5))-methyltransferase [Dinochytrium kinnereticum]